MATANLRGLTVSSLIVALALLTVSTVVNGQPSSSNAQDSTAIALPDTNRVYSVDVDGQRYTIYEASENAARQDLANHIFLYQPPLRFRVNDNGAIEVNQTADGIVVYLEGVLRNSTRTRLLANLGQELGRPISPRQLRPLQFQSISLADADFDSPWRSFIPDEAQTIPQATQRWHRFAFRRPSSDVYPEDFARRLRNADVDLRVVLSYGGSIIKVASVEIITQNLLRTSFLRDLRGDGGARYVTRNQLHDAGASAFQHISVTIFGEYDLSAPDTQWLQNIWQAETVAWNEFVRDRLDQVSRYGFDANDLSADKFTRFLADFKRQMEDENKDVVDVDTAFGAEANFLGFGGGVTRSFSRSKEEVRNMMELSEGSIGWDGELYVPRDITVYRIDDVALDREQVIYSSDARSVRSDARFSYTIGVVPSEEVARNPDDVDLPALQVFRDCTDGCPQVVVVPPGRFTMGSPVSEQGRYSYEAQVTVEIEKWMAVGKNEITFAQWDRCTNDGWCPHRPGDEGWGRGRRPVVNVSWHDAQLFLAWLRDRSGRDYRLLTEAEWEYAARAGTRTARPWGESSLEQCIYANGNGRGTQCNDGERNTAQVGSYEANNFGLHDMLGNVWEWTGDCWNDNHDAGISDASRARRDGNCDRRVFRGGSWDNEAARLRSASRLGVDARRRDRRTGFRVMREMAR